MKALIACSVVCLSFVLAGCEKKPDPTIDPAANASAAPAAAPAAPPAGADNQLAASALDLSKVPVEEQFEKEVEQEVTATNFETQLDALEKEIKVE